jgi:serine/threonine protein phosphatase 1
MKWAVSDIHGCLSMLTALVNKIHNADPNPEFIFLGDYIDRGGDSCGVLDYLINLSKEYSCVFIRGNHDDMFLSILSPGDHKSTDDYPMVDARTTAQWFWRQGLRSTIQSYCDIPSDIDDPWYINRFVDHIPDEHVAFLRNTVDVYIDDKHICGHANPFGTKTQQIWQRLSKEQYIALAEQNNRRIVVGHTPVKYFGATEPIVEPRVCLLDGGPYSPNGFMSALCLDTDQVIVERNKYEA